jgi:hypothetical protein
VNVGPLQVLDQLQFEALRIGQLADRARYRLPPSENGGAVAARADDQFERVGSPLGQRANQNRLQDPVDLNVVGLIWP